MFKITFLLVLISCTNNLSLKRASSDAPKDFSPRELITSSQLLTKIYDSQKSPLVCVPDAETAELLLRTIRPRLEVVIDDIESVLDQDNEVANLVNNCMSDCTCEFISDILKEHQVALTKEQLSKLSNSIKANDKICLSRRQKIFCSSQLFKELDKEKSDFSFE